MTPQLYGTFDSLLIIMWLRLREQGRNEMATNKVSGKALVIPTLAVGTLKSYFHAFIKSYSLAVVNTPFMRVTLFLFLFLHNLVSFTQSTHSPSNFNIDSFLNAKRTGPLGKLFPVFAATSKGGAVSNEMLKNKVVLINFWFEGCHPCMEEMEALNELQQQLKDNKYFLFISFTWENAAAIKRVSQKHHITFAILAASGQECRRLNFDNGYPTHIILDRTGVIKYFHSGGGSTEKEEPREFVMKTLLSKIRSEL
jgi:thiol-disulfide isomerase/thioredoxin